MEIKEWNKCNNCAHAKVCNYSKSKTEFLDTINKQLSSFFLPEFFEFSFECKEFIKQENTKDKKGVFYTL